LTSAIDVRDNADVVTLAANQLVVNSVKGDPNVGDDSDLYDAMGYTRKSERHSGLSRQQKIARRTGPITEGSNRIRRNEKSSRRFSSSSCARYLIQCDHAKGDLSRQL